DAAAMALADVGVAVHGGAGASILAADVVLTREGLSPLLDLLAGSRRVLAVVWRNLGFSLAYNLIGAGLALAGLVGPLLAAVLMPISSLTVILSSALSRTFPSRRGPGSRRLDGASSRGPAQRGVE
ncbi:MAG: heavy metal translocating P-type ATPase, partial [Candidatus Latescibacterota bacterium]